MKQERWLLERKKERKAMKTRIIHTKVWEDQWFSDLDSNSKLLWLYLLSNNKINISGIYEISDRKILFDTSISENLLEKIKKDLSPKAIFYKGWVRICHVDRYNKYRNSPLNEVAYKTEISYIPADVQAHFGIETNTSINTSIDTPINKKQEIINKKSEIENKKQEIRNRIKGFTSIKSL